MKNIKGNMLEELQDKYGIDTLEWQDMILKELKKKMLESALEWELWYELWYKKWKRRLSSALDESKNYRNWHSSKQVLTSDWPVEINVPRDRNGEFEPEILPKRSNDISDWEQRIINMYWLWLSNMDIKAHFTEIYGVWISESKITYITNKVFAEIEDWKNRPLKKIYAMIYLDCIHYKVRQDGKIVSKACYVILWIDDEWKKDVLTMIVWENEWAKFWLRVVNNLRQRWVEDVMIASIDGLKWFPEAIRTVFPQVEIQLCIIHQIRNTTKYISYKDIKEFCTDLKTVYRAIDEKTALENLDRIEEKWWKNYGYAFQSWRNNWAELSTMFAYPDEIRRIMYTTNAIEWFNRWLRKYTKTKTIFPTDASLEKSMYLAMKNVTKKWTGKIPHWGKIYSQLKIYFDGRF
jgi:putative transposase